MHDDALAARIRRLIGPMAGRYVGLAVGLSVGDRTAVVGYGSTGEAGGLPDGRTSFQIGSVTKLFTALLLADAAARGEVTLDQPLRSIVPTAATHRSGRPITLAELASHTSGLPRLPPGMWWQALRDRRDPYAAFTTDDLQAALARPPKRAPGGRVRYSNYGAGVLGHALVRATGVPYDELVRTRIAAPLGLHDTRVVPDESEHRVAVGHTRRERPTDDWHLPALTGAGGLRSSVDDLLTFLRAHLDPHVPALAGPIRTVLEPRHRINRALRIGLGWHLVDRPGGATWWWRNGGTGGFFSFVGFDPAEDTAVAVVTNCARPVDPLGHRLLERPAGP